MLVVRLAVSPYLIDSLLALRPNIYEFLNSSPLCNIMNSSLRRIHMFIKFLCFAFSFLVPLVCVAGQIQSPNENLSRYIKSYQSQSTLHGFMAELKKMSTPESFAHLQKYVAAYDNAKLIKVQFDGNSTVSFEINGQKNQIKFASIDDSKISVNGKNLSFSSHQTFEERWNNLLKLLETKTEDRNALLEMIIPSANAEEAPAANIAGPPISVTGAAMLTDFEKAWKIKKTIVPLGIFALGENFINDGVCKSMQDDLPECFKLEEDIVLLLSAFPEREMASKKDLEVPHCAQGNERPLIDKDATENFSKSFRGLANRDQELSQRVSSCEGSLKGDLNECLSSIGTALKYLCVDLEKKNIKSLTRIPASTK